MGIKLGKETNRANELLLEDKGAGWKMHLLVGDKFRSPDYSTIDLRFHGWPHSNKDPITLNAVKASPNGFNHHLERLRRRGDCPWMSTVLKVMTLVISRRHPL